MLTFVPKQRYIKKLEIDENKNIFIISSFKVKDFLTTSNINVLLTELHMRRLPIPTQTFVQDFAAR